MDFWINRKQDRGNKQAWSIAKVLARLAPVLDRDFLDPYCNTLVGSQPLVIIDGVTQEKRGEAAFKDIHPDDIKAISVLKNESAVSAYGEEGRAGVVIITTKN